MQLCLSRSCSDRHGSRSNADCTRSSEESGHSGNMAVFEKSSFGDSMVDDPGKSRRNSFRFASIFLSVGLKELNALKPNKDFRLWLTSEGHPKFPTILLQSSIKITYEAPPGVKKNLLRTFEIWTPEEFSRGNVTRSQTLFLLAWFHAIVQERRKYIPQVSCCASDRRRSNRSSPRAGRNSMSSLKLIYARPTKSFIVYANEQDDNVSLIDRLIRWMHVFV